MDASAELSQHEKIEIAAANLRVDAATAEVLRAFDAAGVESLLLKGRSIARWLYSEADPRPYRDCDLLVRPADMRAAEAVLERLGFTRYFEDDGMPDWWREHAGEWRRPRDGVFVDLHRSLPGIGVDEESAWRALSAATAEIEIAGHPATALALPARALHVALHAAQHGVEWHKPMADLERAVWQLDQDLWRAAAGIARQLEATEALAVGLRLTSRGREMAVRLELPVKASVEAALHASTPPPVALGFQQLARAQGLREWAEILWKKFVPPASFMRRWHPVASRGRFGLLLAYLWRPVWILRSAPRGLRAWRRARRELSGG